MPPHQHRGNRDDGDFIVSQQTQSHRDLSKRQPLFGGDTFEQFIAILMTLVILQTAVVTYWFTLADDAQGDAGRDAQIFALRGLGQRTTGSIKTGYAQTGAYQRWVEYNTLAKLSEQKGDAPAARRYFEIRDRVAKLSPMLQEPYFDPDTDLVPDISAYEADTFVVETTTLSEQFANQYNMKSAWFDKASGYTTHLTLLAVTLFLLGLATTVPQKSRVRWLMIGTGLFLAGGTLVWMLTIFFQPTSSLSDDAIKAYAQGVGMAYRGKPDEAITAFNHALKLAPTYASAFRERGIVQLDQGDYEKAATDLEQARAAGDNSGETAGNPKGTFSLAWTYYLLGRFDDTIALNRVALKISPKEEWIQFNLALALLASGQVDAAQTEYANMMTATAIQVARVKSAGKEPPGTMWWAIDAGATDLDALIRCVSDNQCDGAPPRQTIKSAEPVKRAANDLRVRLKELSVALEYTESAFGTAKPPAGQLATTIKPFTFTRNVPGDDPITHTTVFTATDDPVYVVFDYAGLQDKQLFVVKVYVNGEEDPRLRVAEELSTKELGESGEQAYLTITTGGLPLSPGD